MKTFQGRTAVITGAGSGYRAGYRVILSICQLFRALLINV